MLSFFSQDLVCIKEQSEVLLFYLAYCANWLQGTICILGLSHMSIGCSQSGLFPPPHTHTLNDAQFPFLIQSLYYVALIYAGPFNSSIPLLGSKVTNTVSFFTGRRIGLIQPSVSKFRI